MTLSIVRICVSFSVCIWLSMVTPNALCEASDQDRSREMKMNNGDIMLISDKQDPPAIWCNNINIYSFDRTGYFVVDVIASKNRSSLLCLIVQGSSRAFSYDHLLWIHRTINANQVWTVEKLFDKATLQTKLSNKLFVSEIGAVDDENPVALLKIGEQTAKEAPFRVEYSWQTWDIALTRLLGKGLCIENGIQY